MHRDLLNPDALELQPVLEPPITGLLIADARLIDLYPDFFGAVKIPVKALLAGEDQKNLKNLQQLYHFFCEHSLSRDEIVHVYGGGTISDLAAYAVSTYKRGCRLHLYPSTLLGMVDAAIGGKTGLNHENLKNLIGSFYPAERIVIHPGFLSSLPWEELRQGMAEMLKAVMLFPCLPLPDFGGKILPNEEDILGHALYKLSLCQSDPYDRSDRMLLNFGHSFGHALESFSNFNISHGDAIALGMNMACDFSLQMELVNQEQYDSRKELLSRYPYPPPVLDYLATINPDDLLPLMYQDKKNNRKLRLVLPVGKDIKLVEMSMNGSA